MASGYPYPASGGKSQQPYYDPESLQVHSQQPTAAPPYHAGQHGHDYDYNAQHAQNQPGRPSPFDTVFDDHAYPSNSRQGSVPGGSTPQPSPYQDTGYYGQAGASPMSSRPNVAEDIPLQDRPRKDGEPNDHVYDAAAAPGQSSRRGKVRVGELGMLGSDKKRIPFVVYFFSLVQAAVFIAEIVKNGELHRPNMLMPN